MARRSYLQAQKEERDAKVRDLAALVKERLNLDTVPYEDGDLIAVQGDGFFFYLDSEWQLLTIAYGSNLQNSTTLGVMDKYDLSLETLGLLLVERGIE